MKRNFLLLIIAAALWLTEDGFAVNKEEEYMAYPTCLKSSFLSTMQDLRNDKILQLPSGIKYSLAKPQEAKETIDHLLSMNSPSSTHTNYDDIEKIILEFIPKYPLYNDKNIIVFSLIGPQQMVKNPEWGMEGEEEFYPYFRIHTLAFQETIAFYKLEEICIFNP